MTKEIPMDNNPIAPKLRRGEVLPAAPGAVPTRLDREIVLVPARTEADVTYGGEGSKSPYTERQVAELDAIRAERLANRSPHEGTLYEVFFPGEDPSATLSDMEIELTPEGKDYLDYKDFEPSV